MVRILTDEAIEVEEFEVEEFTNCLTKALSKMMKIIPSSGKCPASHPYVYNDGEHCCKVNREKIYQSQGQQCDGSKIQRDSKCCEDNKYIKCPSGNNCENFEGKIAGSCITELGKEFYLLHLV